MDTLSEKFRIFKFAMSHRVWLLLISILMLIIIPPYLSENPDVVDVYVKLDFLLIVMACFFIIHDNPWSRYLSILTFLLVIIDKFLEHDVLSYLSQVGISILIFNAFFLVLREAISLKSESTNMILVSITGYFIIGLIGGFLADGLDQLYPGAYSYSTGKELELYNYIYYSFVTMTTLGYGDIIPVTDKSQSLALILVMSGQLYLSVIIAINISKFLQNKTKN